MKEFIKKWMLLFALVVVSAFIIPSLFNGNWVESGFIIKLLFTSLLICLLQLLTIQITVRIPLIKYLIDLVMVLSVVLFFGWIWKWYVLSNVWIIFAMVIPVFIAAIFLDMVKVRQDVSFINEQIKLRQEKLQEENGNDC